MTLAEFKRLLDKLSYKGSPLPIRYSHYEEGKAPTPPYILYFVNGRDDLIADNTNYIARQSIEIELYTKNTEFGLLEELEELLNEVMIVPSIIPFQYLESEKFYITRLSIII